MKLMKKQIIFLMTIVLFLSSCSIDGGDFGDTSYGDSNSINGSTSRFATYKNVMYTLDFNKIKIFSIDNPSDPILQNELTINDELETITIYQNHIYVGARRGVYAVDITNPLNPIVSSSIEHWIAKDPVAITGKYIYSTTRDFNTGRLTIYEDRTNGNFIERNTIAIDQPYGIGIKDDFLFVCDDRNGIIIFNITNRENPLEVATYPSITSPRDVIILGDIMICSAKNEFHLLDIKDPVHPKLVSIIQ